MKPLPETATAIPSQAHPELELGPRRPRPEAWPIPEITSTMDGDWLLLRATPTLPIARAGTPIPAEDLAWETASLPGQVKWALPPGTGYRVQAELPRTAPADLAASRRAALAGFEAALGPLGDCLDENVDLAEPMRLREKLSIEDLLLLCEEAGWPGSHQEDGAVRLGLEVPGSSLSARLVLLPHGLRLCAEICNLAGFTPMQRRALAQLLLRSNACLRWVRGGFFKADGAETAGFEISITGALDAALLAKALAALSVATLRCVREAAPLAQERVAALYLEVGMGSSSSQTTSKERYINETKHAQHNS